MPAKRATAARREHPQLLAVHVHQRVEEHLRELLVRDLAHRAAGLHRLAQLLEVAPGALGVASDSPSSFDARG